MIYALLGWQRQGKTTAMVAFGCQMAEKPLVCKCPKHMAYSWTRAIGNVEILQEDGTPVPGYQYVSNEELRAFIGRMVEDELSHWMVFMDETARVYPSRLFKDVKRTEQLTGIFQDEKLCNWFLMAVHPGAMIDKILREATLTVATCRYSKAQDAVKLKIVGPDGKKSFRTVHPASRVQRRFDSFAPVREKARKGGVYDAV